METNQQKVAAQAKNDKRGHRIGHWARVGVMFISGGFIFPHAMMEDEDNAKTSANQTGKKTN
jgi:hypothetical protein